MDSTSTWMNTTEGRRTVTTPMDIRCRYHLRCGDTLWSLPSPLSGNFLAAVRMEFLVQTYRAYGHPEGNLFVVLHRTSSPYSLIVRLYVNANCHVILGLLCQIVLTALLMVALGVAHFMMYYHTHELQIEGLVMDKWLTRILVHNGLALFIAWEVVELMVSINITMQYNSGKALKPDVASSIVLFAYMILVTIWMILETCILDQFMRYTLTIYPVFIWYFAMALTEQWDHHRNKQAQNIHWLVAALSYTVIIQVWFFIFHISRVPVYPQFQRNVAKYSRIL